MARKRPTLGKLGLKIVVSFVGACLIYAVTMKMVETLLGTVVSNSNEIAKLTRECSDYAATHFKDVSEKNQLFAQCTKERMANIGKQPAP